MKRLLDIFVSICGLLILSPFILLSLLFVWAYDRKSPIYAAPRVGQYGKTFEMYKIRSMVIDADKSGVNSTSINDVRITTVGAVLRKTKFDEVIQLWNVLKGDMSLVGPRPNVMKGGVDLYTKQEVQILSVKPGMTDFSSIVFSDEGDILADSDDPDADYNRLIRPWKSRLGIVYIENQSFFLDLMLIFLTVLAIISREKALLGINKLLLKLNADPDVIEVSKRTNQLVPTSPPGTDALVAKH